MNSAEYIDMVEGVRDLKNGLKSKIYFELLEVLQKDVQEIEKIDRLKTLRIDRELLNLLKYIEGELGDPQF